MLPTITNEFPMEAIAELCRHHHIRRLALFGSALRDDFTRDSDIDLVVEFKPGEVVGLRLFEIEHDLTQLIGRNVDLSTPGFIDRYFRDQVLTEAQDLYVAPDDEPRSRHMIAYAEEALKGE
ncbi:MAG: nucleotidyltransferase family protein [Candidatus Hydrogenedentota bacterium]